MANKEEIFASLVRTLREKFESTTKQEFRRYLYKKFIKTYETIVMNHANGKEDELGNPICQMCGSIFYRGTNEIYFHDSGQPRELNNSRSGPYCVECMKKKEYDYNATHLW